ncbi:hypothetical protein ACLKA7_012632 [Drosophila subpalustris]
MPCNVLAKLFQYPLTEPIGSVPPKINNINDKFQLMQIKLGHNFAMQCPGQAYPVPVVRVLVRRILCPSLEPIGSVPPKITSLHDKFQVLQVRMSEDYSMQCPGQAYPVPIVRLVMVTCDTPKQHSNPWAPWPPKWTHGMNSHLRELNLDLPRLSFVQPNRIPCLHLEPVGSVAPKVDIKDEINYARAALNQSLAIVCPAQSYPVPSFRYVPFQHSALWGFFWEFFLCLLKIAEPVGSVAPKVDPNDRIKWVDKPKGVSLSLLCPAQSYPTPAARLKFLYDYLQNLLAPLHQKLKLRTRLAYLWPSLTTLWLCFVPRNPIQCPPIEPVGSVAPKVEIKDKLGIFVAKSSCSMALLCPAQSYPMPAFSVAPRVNRKDEFNHDRISSSQAIAIQCPAQSYPVPAYSVAPRANKQDGLTRDSIRLGQTVAIFCPAQAYPVPFYSVAPKISVENRLKNAEAQLGSSFTLFCPGQAYPMPFFSVGPRLTSGDKTRNVDVSLDGSFTLLCPAQAYPVPFFRGAAPRVALIQKTNIEYVRIDETVAIMCPAQGYPVPAFRSTVPKVVSLAKFDMKTYEGSSTLALLCPAQGYPVPLFSRVPWLWQDIQVFPFYVQLRDILRLAFEPIGSSPPKINALTYKPNVVELHVATAILCPAQGYPAPSFRTHFKLRSKNTCSRAETS